MQKESQSRSKTLTLGDATQPPQDVVKPKDKPAVKTQLHFSKFHRYQQHGANYFAEIPVGTTLDEILDPMYWAHISGIFRGKYNEITALWDDKSRLVRLFVRFYAQTYAHVEVLEDNIFEDADGIDVPSAYDVKWVNDREKYSVVRKSDSQLMRNGFNTKEHAVAYIETTLKA